MKPERFSSYKQDSAYRSARPVGEILAGQLFEWCWFLLCAWTPRPLNGWRIFWLRLFGARIAPDAFVHPRARVDLPWNLVMGQRACLGDRAHAYNLGLIELKERSTVAQEAYLCTGTHKFDEPELALMTAPIVVERDAFVGARAFVLPGVVIGQGALVGAGSVVTEDLPEWTVSAGNPCRPLKPRLWKGEKTDP